MITKGADGSVLHRLLRDPGSAYPVRHRHHRPDHLRRHGADHPPVPVLLPRRGQQIAARIAYNEIDLVLCFDDPRNKTPNEDIANIYRLCDQNNIPYASNLASAEMLVLGLARGDLDWRNIVNPKTKPFTA